MSKPLVTYPDPERAVVEHLADALAGEDVTVGPGLPRTWTTASDPHLQVACDGTPTDEHPIAHRSTIRVVAWASTSAEAKRLALLAHGHLLAAPTGDLHSVSRLTGLLPAHDRDHDAELASFTVRARVRSTAITGS